MILNLDLTLMRGRNYIYIQNLTHRISKEDALLIEQALIPDEWQKQMQEFVEKEKQLIKDRQALQRSFNRQVAHIDVHEYVKENHPEILI